MRIGLVLALVTAAAACGEPVVSDLSEDRGDGERSGIVPLSECEEAPAEPPAPPPSMLQATVDRLAAEAGWRTPGSQIAISVQDLATGEWVAVNGDVKHVAASSAKAIWVAASLQQVGVGPVEPYAGPIFEASDNYASGSVIDMVGPNAVNLFQWNAAGMLNSAFTTWNFGHDRVASNSPRAMGSDNYFTADDNVTFLRKLAYGELGLSGESTQALLYWMALTPRSGLGGWLGTRLPDEVRGGMMHKAGWLPPGCCGSDATYNTLNEIGLVEVAPLHVYAVSILTRRGYDWYGRQRRFVEYASCEIYKAVAGTEALDCWRPGDPVAP